ncbi:MAG: hypothetical protein RLZZ584_3089 [Pseudomonadota bacterium]|jgi:uncharacterized protein with NRDE domain
MCLAAFALGRHADFPLVLAANRDEYFERPTAPLAWWEVAGAPPGQGRILAGHDLRGGGTWLGLNAQGRLALLTNIRTGRGAPPGVPSRGELVPAWLSGSTGAAALHAAMQARGHVDYNLVTADLVRPAAPWHWISSATGRVQAIEAGRGSPGGKVFGLSNGLLDEPWPKLVALRSRVDAAVAQATAHDLPGLIARLFEALADDRRAPDNALPCTGVPLAAERMLSSAFIRGDDGRYGTRCSTVVVVQRGVGARVIERSFDADGLVAGQVDLRLPGWPGSA